MRRSLASIAGVVLAALLATAGVAAAEEVEMEADRPDFSESPNVVGARTAQIEFGWTRDQVPGFHLNSVGEGLLRLGLSERAELRLGLPSWFSDGFDDGVGSTSVGAKIFLGAPRALATRFGLVAGIDLPSGSRAFRNDGADYEVTLAATRPVGRVGVSSNVSAASESNGDDREWGGSGSLSLGFDLAPRIGAFAETYEFFGDGERPQPYVNAGITCAVTSRALVDVRAGTGWAAAKDDHFIGAGAAFRW